MSKLDELKSSFSHRLDRQIAAQAEWLEAELAALRGSLLHGALPPAPPVDDPTWKARGLRRPTTSEWQRPPSPQALFDLTDRDLLLRLDRAFAELFDLAAYYPVDRLSYPTVYCETLPEFFTPFLETSELSPQSRRTELERLVAEAQAVARRSGGGVFGVNLPGQGCYLNGWLFAYGRDFPPLQAFHVPALLARILDTAIHEKLGHGFLSVYSALGAVKTRLGLEQVRLAQRFGLAQADDPLSSLRRGQANLVYLCSQLLEEGWSTWIAGYLAGAAMESAPPRPRHNLAAIVRAIDALPPDLSERDAIREALLAALAVLFNPGASSLPELHQAVMALEIIGGELDDHFGAHIGQPLRYAAGELLCIQAEENLGAACLPFAALIAANLTFDPAQISLADLGSLLSNDARLHPDARLAAITRLELLDPGSVVELCERAENDLNFSIPPELKPAA